MPRKIFDGAKLDNDIAQSHSADQASPPTARPSLMDAVRGFATFIDTRAKLGWTDAMIAAVLTEAGYPIGEATLRSYRKRLRDEGRLEPSVRVSARGQHRPAASTPLDGSRTSADRISPSVNTGTIAPAPPAPSPQMEATQTARAPPSPPPHRQLRSFGIDLSKLPPDQA